MYRKMSIGVLALCAAAFAIWFSGGDSDFDDVSFAEAQTGTDFESRLLDVGDVRLHVVFAGPEDGEPIILLHGFPEFWFVWRHHIALFAQAGYRVAAPDLRGYNRSDKPRGRGAYSTREYARDIVGLMDAVGWERAHMVGHDVGAHTLWRLIFEEPSRVASAVVVSVPHPAAVDPENENFGRTWYRAFFRTPVIPELLSRSVGLSLTANNLRKTSQPGTFDDEALEVYKSAWDREHAFTTMLGFYRTQHPPIEGVSPGARPRVPVLYLYGMRDAVISPGWAQDSSRYLGDESIKLYPDLSHWLLTEDVSATARDILGFVARTGLNAL